MGGAFMEACAAEACTKRTKRRKARRGQFYQCNACKGMYKHWRMVKRYGSIRAICKKCWREKKENGIYHYKCLEFSNKLLGANKQK